MLMRGCISVWMLVLFAVVLFPACNGGSGDDTVCTAGQVRCADDASFATCGEDGTWGAAVACNDGESCLEGICQPDDTDGDLVGECIPNEAICVGELVQSCAANGAWNTPVSCATGLTCINGGCKPAATEVCVADTETRCNDDGEVETCNSTGTGWTDPTACEDGDYCYDGECIEEGSQICDSLVETRCNDNGEVVHCNADGTAWENPEPCREGERCYDGRCIDEGDIVCEAGTETRCTDDGKVQVCNSTGTDWSQSYACPLGYTCEDDRCVEAGCIPSVDFKCTSSQTEIQWCNEAGDGYKEAEECPPGQVCVEDSVSGCTASSYICIPDSYECVDESTIRQCNDDGSGWLSGTIPCNAGSTGNRCVNGECLSLCDMAELSDSYIGCEYWPVVLPNPQLDDAFKSGDESEFAVVVSNTNDTYAAQVTIEHTGTSFTKSISVPAGEDVTVRLPFKEGPSTPTGLVYKSYKQKNAFRLNSTIPVTVSQFNPISAEKNGTYAHTNDASLLLPTHVLGDEYLVMNYRTMMVTRSGTDIPNIGSFFTVVAVADGTTVTVTANARTEGGLSVDPMFPGTPKVFTLDRGEVLQVGSSVDSSLTDNATCIAGTGVYASDNYCLGPELTGSVVESDKPIAVFGGNECSFVPHYRWACDHLEQQLFPTKSWTTQYIAARLHTPLANHKIIYKIVAMEDGTEITTRPSNIKAQTEIAHQQPCDHDLDRGESCVIETGDDFIVLSNPGHPIMVGQFLVGQNYLDSAAASEGDPAFLLVPPVEQFRYDYVFLVPNTYKTDYITLLTTNPDAEIYLDGTQLTNSFTQISNVNAYKMEKTISDGTHTLTSDSRVGLMVYGYDSYVSYAYPAGLDLTYTPY